MRSLLAIAVLFYASMVGASPRYPDNDTEACRSARAEEANKLAKKQQAEGAYASCGTAPGATRLSCRAERAELNFATRNWTNAHNAAERICHSKQTRGRKPDAKCEVAFNAACPQK